MEYRDPIGDILKKSNDLDENSGKGKPMSKEYQKYDTYQQFEKVARNAGYLPEWIKIQHQISEALSALESFKELKDINKLIKKYNKRCPPPLQKTLITEENYERQKLRW
ncbi:DnaJ family domain-containing protein [Alkalicoccus daliensis]|uniref:DnaJ homologue subfamily C member 28 conserved domain-containing protein n=1 Tax=Alkalicoccus daliensis TaxID=745820 RepID=A0A1H0D5T0_9BACI|nr:DnaJ family domain-containing protein [Alkalicoccus daliensis]SDN65498.1 protein of unknown function [Alkalicoccus daliensis]